MMMMMMAMASHGQTIPSGVCVCDLIPQKIRQVKRELKICTTHTSMALARVQTRFLQNM